jgi:hypothetical protein
MRVIVPEPFSHALTPRGAVCSPCLFFPRPPNFLSSNGL